MSKSKTRRRDDLYEREAAAAQDANRGEHPICNLCDLPVTPGADVYRA